MFSPVLLATIAAMQEFPTAGSESIGPSPHRLERIGFVVQKTIDDKTIGGALTLLLRHGPVAWFEALGMQGSETGKPVRSDTIFRI